MLKKVLIILVLLVTSLGYGQEKWEDFTGKQKAFFYQLTRKIENLKPTIHPLFEFTDSIPYINDTLPDYPYVESFIESDSSKLICHHTEFARKNRGLLGDVGMHYAAWELDLLLQFRNSTKLKYAYLKPKFEYFVQLILENAPSNLATINTNGKYELSPSILNYLSPNLTIGEKMAAIKNSGFTPDEKYAILQSIYAAQEKYMHIRANEIVDILTQNNINTTHYMLAAGDGEDWNDLESIIRTKYNRALPDPKALFNYQLKTKRSEDKSNKNILVSDAPVIKMSTKVNHQTHLHIDAWAYHPERQTTIVVQKGGSSYVLYGKNEQRYVSPDSTFGEGVTYWSLIKNLEEVWIADLKEKIYGKKGFDYYIALYEKKQAKTRMHIKVTEEKLDAIRYTPAAAPKMKKSRKAKKKKKKSAGLSYQDSNYVPHGKLTKTAKKRQIQQHNLIALNGQLETELATLRQLKKEKEEAFDLLSKFETKLDQMKKNMGFNLMAYEKDKLGNYLFTDGATFNVQTQDLTFPEADEVDYFEVILVSFGESVFDKNLAEFFVHFNLSHTLSKDVFVLDEFSTKIKKSGAYSKSDSIQTMEFFHELSNKKMPITIQLNGLGVANGTPPYPISVNTKPVVADETHKNKLFYYLQIQKGSSLAYNLTVWSNEFIPTDQNIKRKIIVDQNPQLNPIEVETAVQAKAFFDNYKVELTALATLWIKDTKQRKTVLKRIKSLKAKTVLVNGEEIKI
ncbi:hypothetical protein DNU06_14025 [Putridiphycobacter roseus]|uniref:Uncharacterized protein n=2 Tax=Putridiphycobacter roseus TaxID=2219161 RepID=A0A2W1NKP9_9FLAO|nr:hypothetical protein DNU06_14025 [Putridiphycobacter roseus]